MMVVMMKLMDHVAAMVFVIVYKLHRRSQAFAGVQCSCGKEMLNIQSGGLHAMWEATKTCKVALNLACPPKVTC